MQLCIRKRDYKIWEISGGFNSYRSQVRNPPLPDLYSKKQVKVVSSFFCDLREEARGVLSFFEEHFKSFCFLSETATGRE